MGKYTNSINQIRLPIILSIGLGAGMLIGATFSRPANDGQGLTSGLQKFKEVLTHIDRNYVDEVDVDKLVEKAIINILENLDPHSAYIPASERLRAN
ncbi:MAG: peptidase S41, partial [Cyclobacteriaceae bacterium]|nr:peptidase S41 [Cyclobacteriaceae bacterium]